MPRDSKKRSSMVFKATSFLLGSPSSEVNISPPSKPVRRKSIPMPPSSTPKRTITLPQDDENYSSKATPVPVARSSQKYSSLLGPPSPTRQPLPQQVQQQQVQNVRQEETPSPQTSTGVTRKRTRRPRQSLLMEESVSPKFDTLSENGSTSSVDQQGRQVGDLIDSLDNEISLLKLKELNTSSTQFSQLTVSSSEYSPLVTNRPTQWEEEEMQPPQPSQDPHMHTRTHSNMETLTDKDTSYMDALKDEPIDSFESPVEITGSDEPDEPDESSIMMSPVEHLEPQSLEFAEPATFEKAPPAPENTAIEAVPLKTDFLMRPAFPLTANPPSPVSNASQDEVFYDANDGPAENGFRFSEPEHAPLNIENNPGSFERLGEASVPVFDLPQQNFDDSQEDLYGGSPVVDELEQFGDEVDEPRALGVDLQPRIRGLSIVNADTDSSEGEGRYSYQYENQQQSEFYGDAGPGSQHTSPYSKRRMSLEMVDDRELDNSSLDVDINLGGDEHKNYTDSDSMINNSDDAHVMTEPMRAPVPLPDLPAENGDRLAVRSPLATESSDSNENDDYELNFTARSPFYSPYDAPDSPKKMVVRNMADSVSSEGEAEEEATREESPSSYYPPYTSVVDVSETAAHRVAPRTRRQQLPIEAVVEQPKEMEPAVPEGLGVKSAYVCALRKKAGTAFSDKCKRSTDLPIAIRPHSSIGTKGRTVAKSSNTWRRSVLSSADVKHGTLKPRLLASEVDDDDAISSPPASPVETPAEQLRKLQGLSSENVQDSGLNRQSSVRSTFTYRPSQGLKLFIANPDTSDEEDGIDTIKELDE